MTVFLPDGVANPVRQRQLRHSEQDVIFCSQKYRDHFIISQKIP
ncbi:Uncharacterized protein dnm_094590 [Desulfonema magnum]|uniref:Uncharacterized protein n=1 Tax=Desulfonema magnum TaxID=45655 RepID=A0A975GV58_9BACT|nr:Uncharacterized protein dnm_094590 [Desulfonema magnum]